MWDQILVPCFGRQSLYHWEVPMIGFRTIFMAVLLRCHSHTMQLTQLKGTSQRILVRLELCNQPHSLIPEHSIQGLGAGVRV